MTRRRRSVRSALASVTALAAVAGAGCQPSLSPVTSLASIDPLTLTGQGESALTLDIPADTTVVIRTTGQAIDVRIALRDSDGNSLAQADAPGKATGTEVLVIDPGPARRLSLVVAGNDYATVRGDVTVEAQALPAVTRGDRRRIEALHLEMAVAMVDVAAGPDTYRRAADDLAQAARLYEELGDQTAAARARLEEAWVHGWKVWDYPAAVRTAEAALEHARDAGALDLQAHALLWLGSAQTSVAQSADRSATARGQSMFAAARQSLEDAAHAYARLDLPALEALALNYSGVTEHYAGNWEAAEARYEAASKRWLAIRDTAHRTLALQSLALLWHERGDPRRAIEYFDQVLEWQALIPPTDYAYILYNSALPYYVLGQFDDAIERYYGAMRILEDAGDRPYAARALHGIAAVWQAAGEPARAGDVIEQVIAMRPAGSDDRARAYALLLLGEIEQELGHGERAIALHEEALSLASAPSDEIRARVALAGDLVTARRHDDAREHLEAALDLPLPETHRIRMRAWREMGVVQAALSNRRASEAAFVEALRLCDQTGSDLERAYVLEARARTAFDMQQFARAAEDAAAAMAVLTRTSSLGIHANQRAIFLASRRGTLDIEIDALMVQAASARKDGQAEQARMLERQAFEASDRSRGVLLLDALAAEHPDVPNALLARQRDLLEQLAGKRSRLDALLERAEQDERAVKTLSAEIVQVRSELDAMAARIGTYDRSATPDRSATLAEQALMPPADTLVAEYFLGATNSWLFLVGDEGLVVKRLPARSEIDRLAIQLHQQWSSPAADADRSHALVQAIGDLLISPILKAHAGSSLLLVPDGSLHLLPLSALVQMADPAPVGRHIVTIPSLLALGAADPQRPPAPHLLAMIADPVFGADDPRLGLEARELRASLATDAASNQYASTLSAPEGLQRLPAAAIEARAILAEAPPTQRLAFVGFDARKDRILSSNLDDYRIVHFATHAWSDSRDPALATLALSSLDPAGHRIDGVLRAADIASLRLQADLVVLSGCETALGREIDGEGLLGLSSAFLRAGAESVVASLWRVPDTSSAYLMREFYRALIGERKSPDEAMQIAQIEVRSKPRWADPYYWAGFQVVSVSPAAAIIDNVEDDQ